MTKYKTTILIGVGLAATLLASACSDTGGVATKPAPTAVKQAPSAPAPTRERLPQPTSGLLPGVAPESARVDLEKPTFSNPASITNPLLPLTNVDHLIQVGQKDGRPHRTEFTMLPSTKTIKWNGEQTETHVFQFVAYLDGRILEHALDFLAQADDRSVWYFGEDVFNYKDGVIADYHGTWLAGKDGPPAMIMPASPKVGNVYRVENIPGMVFEEVTVRAIDQTVEGPRGLVEGAIRVEQLNMDGMATLKAFAPGYGEFLAEGEDAAVALPTDALSRPVPAELQTILTGAEKIFDTESSSIGEGISSTLGNMTDAWDAHQAGDLGNLFPKLDIQMGRALSTLREAVEKGNAQDARNAAFNVAIATLDLQMPYRPLAEVDLARFSLWTRRVVSDSAAADAGPVTGDATVLGLIWDRVGHKVVAPQAKGIAEQIGKLHAAANSKNLSEASRVALAIQELLRDVR